MDNFFDTQLIGNRVDYEAFYHKALWLIEGDFESEKKNLEDFSFLDNPLRNPFGRNNRPVQIAAVDRGHFRASQSISFPVCPMTLGNRPRWGVGLGGSRPIVARSPL